MKKLFTLLCGLIVAMMATAQIAPNPTDGQVLTTSGHSVTVVGYHYTGTLDYELFIMCDEVMDGLGGSWWYTNGMQTTDMRGFMTVSDNGLQISVTATSTTVPQLYTPLYVMMPGEINFGLLTIDWVEMSSEGPAPITSLSLSANAAAAEVQATKRLSLTAYDQNGNSVAPGYLTFTSNNESIATVNANGTVTGIAEGTAAITATSNSDPTVSATLDVRVTPAPDPYSGTEYYSGDHVVNVLGLHYTGTNLYELIIRCDEVMDGLGGSFWHINGNQTSDIRTNMTKSADGHTITCTAESTTPPQLYTPLFVMMPGEINFGMFIINWLEKEPGAGITAISLSAPANEVQATKELTLTVADQDGNAVSAGNVTFTTSNAAIATVNANGVVTGVTEGNVTITATLKSDESITASIDITVTAAPDPRDGMDLYAGGHHVNVVGYHYNGSDLYELIITSEEVMNGLGGSWWYTNGMQTTDMRYGAIVEPDGHTITVYANSSTDPQIYTPFYVMMPGEINFGYITITWLPKDIDTAIDDITSASSVVAGPVYTIDGRLMQRVADTTTLPAGFYIIGGKKVVVAK